MKITILSCNAMLYSSKRLVQACQQRGYDVTIINPHQSFFSLCNDSQAIYSDSQQIECVDAVIPRVGLEVSTAFYVCALTKQFELMGVFSLNSANAIKLARDKLHSLQLLHRNGFNIPNTAFGHSPSDIPILLEKLGSAPFIVKFLESSQGIGVVLCESNKAAESVLQSFMQLQQPVIVQEYIKESIGADIRCFVIGDKVVAAMKRQAQLGEFRSNLHRGGVAELVELTAQEHAIAINATNLLGLHVAGVDILRSERGPLILEVNASPGLEGIETITKQDIAGMMIDYIARNVSVAAKTRCDTLPF